jgi:hypothetical protein
MRSALRATFIVITYADNQGTKADAQIRSIPGDRSNSQSRRDTGSPKGRLRFQTMRSRSVFQIFSKSYRGHSESRIQAECCRWPSHPLWYIRRHQPHLLHRRA